MVGDRKIKVRKSDQYFKNNREKIERALTYDDVIKVITLLNKGFSIRKIYFLAGYSHHFIRNVSRINGFLHKYLPKDDLEAELSKDVFIVLLKRSVQDAIKNDEDEFIEQLINVFMQRF